PPLVQCEDVVVRQHGFAPLGIRLGLVSAILSLAGCAEQRTFHLRGELDRRTWVVRSCASGASYRLVGSSGDAANFLRLERELGVEDRSEPVLIELDVSTLPGGFVWEDQSVSEVSEPQIERGTCPPIAQ
ncbi:MAG: hypothetical protein ACRERC_25240, partial [Candidatus Binatia bacterium]